ncbi:MAG TPA: hypothetical protein VFY29_18550 [Terriglobia bacterium]|nr:hypothetical protein [Terriglobia bacterium]
MKSRVTISKLILCAALWLPAHALGQEPPKEADMMKRMESEHHEMMELMQQAMKSLSELQNAKDPATMKSRMAEHAAILERMRAKMAEHEEMMKSMSEMMSHMMGGMKKSEPAPEPDHSEHH